MDRKTACVAMVIAAFMFGSAGTVAAQASDSKIWSGVFAPAQAERGKQVFLSTCTTCHSFDLKGNNGRGPAIVGDPFMANWETENLGNLFARLKSTMPRNNPGSLTDDVYLELLAYVLQENGFPAGTEALKAEALSAAVIVGKGGTRALPNFAMVEMVGCLVQSDQVWRLTSTSEPVATKDQPLSPGELKDAVARPLGADTFRLVSVNGFEPESHKGHKVHAKGLLFRGANDNRLNVTSLHTLGPSCPTP